MLRQMTEEDQIRAVHHKYEIPEDTVKTLLKEGIRYLDIDKSALIACLSGKSIQEILARRSEKSFGRRLPEPLDPHGLPLGNENGKTHGRNPGDKNQKHKMETLGRRTSRRRPGRPGKMDSGNKKSEPETQGVSENIITKSFKCRKNTCISFLYNRTKEGYYDI